MATGETSFNIDAPNVTEKVDIAELGAYIDFVGRWRAAIVNNVQIIEQVIEIPTYVYLFVSFTEDLGDTDATLASYQGITLDVRYGEREEKRVYFTPGDFLADYQKAVAWVEGFGQADGVIPFLASSTLDTFMFEGGFDTVVNAADQAALDAWRTEGDEIPFASDADLAAADADEAARERIVTSQILKAMGEIPAEKLAYALAKVVSTSAYNTDYPGAPLGRDKAIRALEALGSLLGY